MQQNLLSVESELMKKFKDQREEQLQLYNSNEDDRARIEKIKIERAESDQAHLRQLVNSLDKKLDTEIVNRAN